MKKIFRGTAHLLSVVVATIVLAGCPLHEYDEGFEIGFASNEKYWEGFEDSYYTEPPYGPILYQGNTIPWIDDDSYDAGYYDGLRFAYNDGYYVSYDFGFTIGFSEGYDLAFNSFWYDLLLEDAHPEYQDGSFMDGYMDGFSEGSVFGAFDYKAGLTFDWEDAMWDYRSGTDLYLEELGFGTRDLGVVEFYELDTDPNELYAAKSAKAARRTRTAAIRTPRPADKDGERISPRTGKAVKSLKQGGSGSSGVVYRPLTSTMKSELNRNPLYSPRSAEYQLQLPDTWMTRIQRYMNNYTD